MAQKRITCVSGCKDARDPTLLAKFASYTKLRHSDLPRLGSTNKPANTAAPHLDFGGGRAFLSFVTLPDPLNLLWVEKKGGARLPWAASCLCLAVGVLRLVFLSDSQAIESFDRVYHETQFRFDSLLFGCLLAYAHFTHAEYFQSLTNLQRLSALTVAVGLISWPLWLSHYRWESLVFGYPALYLGWGAITILFVSTPDSKFLRLVTATVPAHCIRWVGVMSYTFYLWHNHGDVRGRVNYHAVSGFMKDWNESVRWIVANTLYFALAGLAAYLTAKCIEQPALRFRDRRFPARAKISETTVRI